MVNKIVSFSLAFIILSCTYYLPGFDFELFDGTPVEKLAKAVEDDDSQKINKILSKQNVDIDYQEPKYGHTLLMLAVANNKIEAVRALLLNNADVKLQAKSRHNVFMIVCNEFYSEICDTTIASLLLKRGADINHVRLEKNYATEDKYKDLVANIPDGKDATPLNTALFSDKCLDFIKFLVNNGADINLYPTGEPYSSPVAKSLIRISLSATKYLIIDKKAKIPEYVLLRHGGMNKPKIKVTLSQFLKEQKYEPGSENYRYREEILNYLKSIGKD